MNALYQVKVKRSCGSTRTSPLFSCEKRVLEMVIDAKTRYEGKVLVYVKRIVQQEGGNLDSGFQPIVIRSVF